MTNQTTYDPAPPTTPMPSAPLPAGPVQPAPPTTPIPVQPETPEPETESVLGDMPNERPGTA
jgi:hypothetical protein